jgi:membrane-associated phospholipid phosphatase
MNNSTTWCWKVVRMARAVGFSVLVISTAHAACTGDGASGGILRLDRCDEFEATGLYSRSNQTRVDLAVIAGTITVALWSGSESPTGRTAWKAFDSIVTTAVATEVMKNVFQRPRPAQSNDPDLWRQGKGNKSFPSGEVALMAAFVTPIIIEHRQDTPVVWALAALPIYMGRARLSSQGHWLSDVLVGAGVGIAGGYFASGRKSPWLLLPTGDGVFAGFATQF